jgi:hypothetical protein
MFSLSPLRRGVAAWVVGMGCAQHPQRPVHAAEDNLRTQLAESSSSQHTRIVIKLEQLVPLKVISSWQLPAENTVSEVRFDPSAQFLAVSGTDLRVYANKTWDELLKFDE